MAIIKKEIIEGLQGKALIYGEKAVEVGKAIAVKAKDGQEKVAEDFNQFKCDMDLKTLKPIFQDDVQQRQFPMIRVVARDEKHALNPVCAGSIGHETEAKGLHILNLYPEYANGQGISFYPFMSEDVYFVDPCNEKLYISLDEYFTYTKKARVVELTKIAQALGAKHIKITLKERKKSFVSKDAKANANMAKKGGASTQTSQVKSDYSNVEIAADTSFEGHAPYRPEVIYFANEQAITTLIDMRMEDNTLQKQSLCFKYNASSGIKEKNAIQIDAALAAMKLKGAASVLSEAQRESWIDFQYDIEF